MLHATNGWGKIISSVDGTRPTTAFGASVVPLTNSTLGLYTTLLAGASVTDDVYGIEININNVGQTTVARDCLATLAFDPAGGTTFTDFVDLLCGSASQYAGLTGGGSGGGARFWFPLWIKAGTTIGMRGSVSTVDVTAFNAFVKLYCKPSRPELIWCGQKIEQLGVVVASSTGTSVTAGTTSEGTWTSIGTTTRNHRFYEFGFGLADTASSSNGYHVDISIGDASNKHPIILDAYAGTTTAEMATKTMCPTWAESKSGDIVYARTQVGPSSTDSTTIAIYAMGD